MTITNTHSRRSWALRIVSLAPFLIILDTLIIGIAIPEIRGALGFSEASLQCDSGSRLWRAAAAPRRRVAGEVD